MNALLRPFIRLMIRLSIAKKIFALALLFFVPVGALTFCIMREIGDSRTKMWIVLLAGVSLLVAVGMFAAIYRSIVHAAAEFERTSRQIAAGDLSARVRLDARGELKRVETAFNRIADVFASKMTERQEAEEQMKRKAYFDALTGLPNRFLLQDRLRMAIAHAQRSGGMLGILFVDLDGFKQINDTLGHRIGDLLLQGIADRIAASLRESDTVSRLGGDEFVILLPDLAERQDAAKVARKIIGHLRKGFVFEGRELHVSASVGVSVYPYDGVDVETLLNKADAAMYRVKTHGKNDVQIVDGDGGSDYEEKLKLERELREALEKGEFDLLYQPIVDLATGLLARVEALLRWNHPDRGTMRPGEFLELAQQTGLVVKLDEFALREACRQAKRWDDELGVPMSVSVNLYLHPYWRQRLEPTVVGLLDEFALAPERLTIEFTENRIFQNLDDTLRILQSLKSVGIGVMLDDFGTGFSSLTHLKRLPIDGLKIDRTFVKDIPQGAKDSAIAASIVMLARQLQMNVVAEGVETEEQLRFLRQVRCVETQGYFVCPPVTANALVEKLRANAAFLTP